MEAIEQLLRPQRYLSKSAAPLIRGLVNVVRRAPVRSGAAGAAVGIAGLAGTLSGKKDNNKPPEIPTYKPSPLTEFGWMIEDATEDVKNKFRLARVGAQTSIELLKRKLFGQEAQAPDPSYDPGTRYKLLEAAKNNAIQDAIVNPNYGLFADPSGKGIERAQKNIDRFYAPTFDETKTWETGVNFSDLSRAGNAGGLATDAYQLFQPGPDGYMTDKDIAIRDTSAPQMANLSGTISNPGVSTPEVIYPKADLLNVDDVVVPPPLMERLKNSVRGLNPNVKLGLGLGAGALGAVGIYSLVRKVQEDKRREEEERAARAMQLRQMQMTDNSESY